MYILYIKKKYLVWLVLCLLFVVFLVMAFNKTRGVQDVPTISPIYIGNTLDPAVALMVNVDWGEDILPGMLEVLRQKNVKATFFITGRFAKKFPELVKQISEGGHEIGNHGYSHPHADKISIEQNMNEITETEKVITGLGITLSKIFAPPYGEHKPHVLQAASSLGYKTIMWTLDTVDWKEPAPETIVKKIAEKADNGALILMHPKECTLKALPSLTDTLIQKQFVFKTVSEIIQ